MRVIYDISTLGLGYRSGERAGVFRAVERLAYGLATAPECELVFSAALSIRELHSALAYLAATPGLRAVPLPHPYQQRPIRHLLDSPAKAKLDRAIPALGTRLAATGGPLRLGLKTAYRGLLGSQRRLEARYPPIEAMSLAAADLYHSPMHAIPPQVKARRGLGTLLTVYDLIPILHPQFFRDTATNSTNAAVILQSILPDGWALCISEATKTDLCNYLPIAPERVWVTYLAADPDLFYPCTDPAQQAAIRQKYGIPAEPYLLSVNTLEPRKNMAHAISAFARLVQEQAIPDLCFVLVGAHGWDYEAIFDTIAHTPGLAARVIVTGYVADGDLAALYSGALAFVYPSLYEGFGLPPLEAMQCGVPVITSNTAALPEVVGDAGLLVDPHDKDALCQALWTLNRDADQRAALAAAGLARARRFSWAQTLAQTRAAYRAALDAR